MIKNHLAGIRIAFSMMTILPFFRLHEFKAGCNGYAAAYYPLVGLVLGGIVYAFYALFHGILPETFLRVALFALFTALYGALHLDGFVDTIDGLFAPASRALEVMKEPTIGAMGAIYGFLFLALKLAAFMSIEEFWLFALIPMLSRFGGTFAMYAFPYVRPRHGVCGEDGANRTAFCLLRSTCLCRDSGCQSVAFYTLCGCPAQSGGDF